MVRRLHLELLTETFLPSRNRRLNYVLGSQKGVNNMLTSILGARLSWHFANGSVFGPAIVRPEIVDYRLKEGHTLGRMPSSASTTRGSRSSVALHWPPQI